MNAVFASMEGRQRSAGPPGWFPALVSARPGLVPRAGLSLSKPIALPRRQIAVETHFLAFDGVVNAD